MSKQAATQDYGAQSIEVLEQLEAVRKRPGMYLGGKDAAGCLRAAIEIVDNCVDEHIMGFGNVVVVHYDLATRFVTVADRGRGVPVAIHAKTKESALTTVFTKLHAGGKFGGGSYAKTGGLHGVGASCTNAVSDSFEAWSFQSATDGARKAWHYQKFSKGKPLTKVVQKDPPKPWCDAKQGTIVRFHLDAEIFGTHVIDPKTFLGKLKDLSLLNPGLKFICLFGGKRFEFISEHGLMSMVYNSAEKESMLGKPFRLYEKGKIDLALCWYDDDSGFLNSYVNSSTTGSGGCHVNGFKLALTSALREASETDYEPKYWMMGLRAALNWRMDEPVYRGQTKDELASEVDSEVKSIVLPKLALFLKQNPQLVKRLADRAARFKKNEERFKADNKAVRGLELGGKDDQAIDPSKLIQSDPGVPPHLRELVLVEGDSAGGTCFVSDTFVRLINGERKNFTQLIKDSKNGVKNYGYAHDVKTQRTVAVELKDPRVTKSVTELIEIELDNGEVIRCTPDHRWLDAHGKYVRADSLQVDQELLPHTEYVHDSRRYIVSPLRNKDGSISNASKREVVFRLTANLNKTLQRTAKRLKAAGKTVQIHHDDHNKLNDHPDNLTAMDEREHFLEHRRATQFTTETTTGDRNGHARMMKSDPEYRARAIATASKASGEYWGKDSSRKAQAKRVRSYFADPKNKEKTSASNRKFISDTYIEIARSCKRSLNETSFNAAKAKLAEKRGVARINIRFDYWTKFFNGSFEQFVKEIINAN